MESGLVVVFVTAPRGKGAEIARRLLGERLAACVNVGSVRSMYWWEGRIEEDEEELLVIKTTVSRLEELIERVKEIHPYSVPEVIALPVIACLGDYCRWARSETKPQRNA
ncbi:cation tolerance protein CutA [Pyrodictium occultum]|uniref:Cation tolerance protein CutA n=1 Tax=Pyrodictium occultum TaxID=2309 RepID=A0A0V8RXC5_PYROC|nr:divalent-cation tolerance protein CutA [Pyrodictium occultum]KSW12610.1 cation tolerance protein CutA [Pyrodictium occultum]